MSAEDVFADAACDCHRSWRFRAFHRGHSFPLSLHIFGDIITRRSSARCATASDPIPSTFRGGEWPHSAVSAVAARTCPVRPCKTGAGECMPERTRTPVGAGLEGGHLAPAFARWSRPWTCWRHRRPDLDEWSVGVRRGTERLAHGARPQSAARARSRSSTATPPPSTGRAPMRPATRPSPARCSPDSSPARWSRPADPSHS